MHRVTIDHMSCYLLPLGFNKNKIKYRLFL